MTTNDDARNEVEAIVEIEVWATTTGESVERVVGDQQPSEDSHVVLTDDEAKLLARILSGYLGDLRMEITDTDNPGMRRDLHKEEEQIRALLGRLPNP